MIESVLKLPMQENDADATTVGDYLRRLLKTLWMAGETFSGKRPFGNSGWEDELYTALVVGGFVGGSMEEGYLEDVDYKAANALIFQCIDYVFANYG